MRPSGLAPLVFLATRRWPIRSGRVRRSILAHAALAAAFLLAKIWLDLAFARLLGAGPPAFPGPAGPPGAGGPGLLSKVVRGLGPNAVAYAVIVAVNHAVDFYRKYRERELASSRLEAQLASARLQALEMQLRPHFLFNALNAIAALVRKEPELAEDMIVALSGLLRTVLQRGGAQEVRLGEEVDLARMYLDIERIRFRDRLRVEVAIAAGCEDVLVPSMILQPLAENAVRHGVARSSRAGRVLLRAERFGERLVLTVEDDGPGLPPEGPEGIEEHVGLSNTRERLRQLHGGTEGGTDP